MNFAGRKPKIMLAMSELFTLLRPEEEPRHLDFARAAEDEGIAGLFVSEHVVMGPQAGALGRNDNPRQFVMPGMQDPATPWPAPLIKLAAIAGATRTIRLIAIKPSCFIDNTAEFPAFSHHAQKRLDGMF